MEFRIMEIDTTPRAERCQAGVSASRPRSGVPTSLLSASRTSTALAVGWSFASLASFVGLLGSLQFDMPAAPSILVSLTLFLAVHGFVLGWRRRVRSGASAVEEIPEVRAALRK